MMSDYRFNIVSGLESNLFGIIHSGGTAIFAHVLINVRIIVVPGCV